MSFTVSLLKRGVNRQTDISLEFCNFTRQINECYFKFPLFSKYYTNISKDVEINEIYGVSGREKI